MAMSEDELSAMTVAELKSSTQRVGTLHEWEKV